MKRVSVVAAVALFIGASWTAIGAEAQDARVGGKSTTQLLRAEAVKWLTVRPGEENIVLWGDPRTGASGRFNRFAAGFEDRPHFHTFDLRVVIISGTMVVQVADGLSTELGAGSYALIPGGSPHTHSCKSGSACVLFLEQDGPSDTTSVQ
jgi:quercetin dioxygenase-like cupin family protein